MPNDQDFITQEDAAARLGVTRATLYYYMRALDIKGKKFPLDRHVYLAKADFEQIKEAKESAQARSKSKDGEEAA